MKERFCSVIIFGPRAPRAVKLSFSRASMTILWSTLLVAVLIAAVVAVRFPQAVSDRKRAELEAENRALRVEAVNAAIDINRLKEKVVSLEEKSQHMNDLMRPGTD